MPCCLVCGKNMILLREVELALSDLKVYKCKKCEVFCNVKISQIENKAIRDEIFYCIHDEGVDYKIEKVIDVDEKSISLMVREVCKKCGLTRKSGEKRYKEDLSM